MGKGQARGPCEGCGGLSDLFDDLLEMQTEVVQCLSDYFDYNPKRVPYLIYPNVTDELICSNLEGCRGYEGGTHYHGIGVLFKGLSGDFDYGMKYPSRPEQLYADKHETTHYFVYSMLHTVPSWFNEAVAIQTNERLACHPQELPWGDTYLVEREGDAGGINMDDGTYLNYNFYRRLRDGETSLSDDEFNKPHIIGTLFIMGLKEDYDCDKFCVRDIVTALREYEHENCLFGQASCSLNRFIVFAPDESEPCPACEGEIPIVTGAFLNIRKLSDMKPKIVEPKRPKIEEIEIPPIRFPIEEKDSWEIWAAGNPNINNEVVKQKTEEVIGEDVTQLWELLRLDVPNDRRDLGGY
ncbi:MAG: hypothetical protein KJ955_03630 [Nanoarchaeota archaeon]|nr:hypothetical protein [Nanoarchaeota archaeon]